MWTFAAIVSRWIRFDVLMEVQLMANSDESMSHVPMQKLLPSRREQLIGH
jgi:hypothetical protein